MIKLLKASLLIFGLLTTVQAQNFKLDSLKQALELTDVDSVKVQVLNDIAFQNISINPIVAKDDVILAYEKSIKLDFQKGKARSLAVMGGVYWGFGNYKEALEAFALVKADGLGVENRADVLFKQGYSNFQLKNGLHYLSCMT